MKPMDRASGVWYRKPRPVIWENLFFGKTSPLASLFSSRGENGQTSLAKYIFNLDVEIEHDWLGFSREINRVDGVRLHSEHFYAFGVLTAYAYLFGIRDLHRHNLVLTETHLQVVDAEVVLTDLILPNETVLLPFKDIEFARCGLAAMIDSMDVLSDDDKRQIFSGYFDLFATVYRSQPQLIQIFDKERLGAPIRVIVRNTRDYKKHLDGSAPINKFLSEERIQLDRGDIPYFFKLASHDALFWISSETGEISSVAEFGEFSTDVARHARAPIKLIGDAATIERKMVQGAFLLQKHLNDSQRHDFGWNGKRLTLDSSGCENQSTGQVFRKKSSAPMGK